MMNDEFATYRRAVERYEQAMRHRGDNFWREHKRKEHELFRKLDNMEANAISEMKRQELEMRLTLALHDLDARSHSAQHQEKDKKNEERFAQCKRSSRKKNWRMFW